MRPGDNGGPKKGDEVAAKKVAVQAVEAKVAEAGPPLYVPRTAVPVVGAVGAQAARVEVVGAQVAQVGLELMSLASVYGLVDDKQGSILNVVDNVAGHQENGNVAKGVVDREADVLTATASGTQMVTASEGVASADGGVPEIFVHIVMQPMYNGVRHVGPYTVQGILQDPYIGMDLPGSLSMRESESKMKPVVEGANPADGSSGGGTPKPKSGRGSRK